MRIPYWAVLVKASMYCSGVWEENKFLSVNFEVYLKNLSVQGHASITGQENLLWKIGSKFMDI